MIVKDKKIEIYPECDKVRVFDNHIEIPICTALEYNKFFSNISCIEEGADLNVSLLIPTVDETIDINDKVYLHILDSRLKRTKNYNDFLDKLFEKRDWFELNSLAEPCLLFIDEKINILAGFIPIAN